MKNWVIVVLVAFGIILQSSLMDKLAFFGVMPDLVLILAVSFGLLLGPVKGAAAGFAGGFILDLLLGRFLGLHALTRGLAGYLVGLAEPRVWKENPVVPVFACFTMTILSELIVYLLLLILGRSFDLVSAWRQVIFPASIYNGLLSVPFHWLILRWGQTWRYEPGRHVR